MTEIYPANLPLPEYTGYTVVQSYGQARTNLPGPLKNQTTYYNAPRAVIGASWAMDDATYSTWLTWIKDNAFDWFYLPVVSPNVPVDITSTQLVRAMSPAAMTLQGYNWQRVGLTLEIQPAQDPDPLAPTPVYSDFISAGSPGVPSPDIIDAGSPGAPSPDLITASIYGYGY